MNPYRQTFRNRARPFRNPAFARRMAAIRNRRTPVEPMVLKVYAADLAEILGMLNPPERAVA